MKDKGLAHMGIGYGQGENKALEAVKQAVASPLLETTIEGATGLLINIKGGKDLTQDDVSEAAALVREVVDADCNIILGTSIDENMHDEVEITLIATGFSSPNEEKEEENEIDKAKSIGNNGQTNEERPRSMFADYMRAPREEDKAEEEDDENVELEETDDLASSRVGIKNTAVPPWIEKLRKNRR